MAIIGLHSDATTTPLGLGLVLLAGLSWAVGNMVAKASGPVERPGLRGLVEPVRDSALIVLSLVFEGWPAMVQGVQRADLATWAAVLWQTVGNTLFGYAAWGWLLARHPAATVTPDGPAGAGVRHGRLGPAAARALPGWKLAAAALVLTGLAVNMLWPRLRARTAVAA
jgi:O-acetylserine/cysteine efflux transporter